jgi:hypothetical protein
VNLGANLDVKLGGIPGGSWRASHIPDDHRSHSGSGETILSDHHTHIRIGIGRRCCIVLDVLLMTEAREIVVELG